MNCFEIVMVLTTLQGNDRDVMACILECLHAAKLLPIWGPGETSAELTAREVVSILLASTALKPDKAAQHAVEVAALLRYDGLSLGAVLTSILDADHDSVLVDRVDVAADGTGAVIWYLDGSVNTFGRMMDATPVDNIHGDLIAAIATKISVRNDLKNIVARRDGEAPSTEPGGLSRSDLI